MPTRTALRPAGVPPLADPSADRNRRAVAGRTSRRRWGLPLTLAAAVAGMAAAMLVPVGPTVPPGARAWTRYLGVGGRRRSELVVAPRSGTAGLPLYVVLHGSDATPAFEERRDGFAYLAGQGRAVLVYPAGFGESWNAGQGCCGPAGATRSHDVAFVEAVVADAVAHLGVERRRVYLVGYSNGGKMALRVLAADPSAFAGVAVYAATPLVPAGHGPPVPVLLAGGTADSRTPWAGPPRVQNGAFAPSVTGATTILRRRDQAEGKGEVRELAGGRVTVTTWRGSSPRRVVRLVAYQGRGHAWPQAHDSPLQLAPLIVGFFDTVGSSPADPTSPAGDGRRRTSHDPPRIATNPAPVAQVKGSPSSATPRATATAGFK